MTTTEILTGIKTWVLSKLSLKQDVIQDLAAIRSGASAGASAVQPSDLSEYFNDASYDTSTHRINFYHGQNIVAYVDASPFIVDGMVDDVRIENGYLVIDFNTASGKQDISIPLTDIFDPSNYYSKAQTDTLLGNKVDKVSGKGLSTNDYTNAEKEKLSGLQNYDDTQVRQLIGQKQDIIQDLDTIRSGASAGSTAYQKPQGGIPSTDMSQDVQTSLGKADTALQEHQSLDAYAKNDGYYEGMGVGTADNLTGQTERTDDAMYRKTGGSEEVASGTATIANIKGQTVAWNQIAYGLNEASEVYGITRELRGNALHYSGTSTRTTNFTGVTLAKAPINTHKYYLSAKGIPNTCGISVRGVAGVDSYVGAFSSMNFGVYIPEGVTIDADVYFACIDLTLIYGAGNEPSTPEQFEADYFKWFGKPLTYEEYDAGSLCSVQLDAIKTTGFNQWDEKWELGTYNASTGEKQNATNNVRCVNYIPCLHSTQYFVNFNDVYICFYDGFYNYLGNRLKVTNKNFTTPSNARYFRFVLGTQYGNTYRHDICINISDTSRNGEYEPYEEHSVSLPVTTITGKLNGEGESVVVFPDGMKSAGTAYDEIYTVGDKTYAIKRVGSVDLGTLNWIISATSEMEYRMASYAAGYNIKGTGNVSGAPNLICAKYQTIAPIETESSIGISYYDYNRYIFVGQNNYTDTSAFKTTMSGVMLYYELATPLVYELDTFDLPKPYQVDGNGTEEQIQKSGVQGLAAILTILYGVDAVKVLDKLPQNCISEKSMDNFLAQLNTVTGGTWTKTWNNNTGEWDFSFTPNAQTNDTNTNETI